MPLRKEHLFDLNPSPYMPFTFQGASRHQGWDGQIQLFGKGLPVVAPNTVGGCFPTTLVWLKRNCAYIVPPFTEDQYESMRYFAEVYMSINTTKPPLAEAMADLLVIVRPSLESPTKTEALTNVDSLTTTIGNRYSNPPNSLPAMSYAVGFWWTGPDKVNMGHAIGVQADSSVFPHKLMIFDPNEGNAEYPTIMALLNDLARLINHYDGTPKEIVLLPVGLFPQVSGSEPDRRSHHQTLASNTRPN